ncbi:gluconate 2-dehydrogenase subunit 3 family protein [Zunongwangia pacifica]|uniref:Gluconate 2-dehydrogenase subunit 3 family protein n=1 Tax=Zunongwangia pacifica TaxID=2911062 RepID=A0A9X1ZLX5_9FLAO|nr:gluconate 2-dehydrogenase subunit 3 family protein [Zunongwangia pacifica]MCL6217027.1 gluconate 2-dehydrogenase subunit 3 family protein [Zunongwangia pacifica]
MKRREALKNVALLLGGTVIGGSAFVAGCQSDRKKESQSDKSLFSEKDIEFMNEIGEVIIPTTDTPGAKAAEVGSFMAIMVTDCYDEEQRKTFVNGLNKMKNNFSAEYGHFFEEAKLDERTDYLNTLELEVETYYRQKKTEDPEHFYRMLKELTLLGYFTSEVGATQALNYIQTPGSYKACIPYEEGEKAWAIA